MHAERLLFALSLFVTSCVGSTGADLVEFPAWAAGPVEGNGGAMSFRSGRGFSVTLTRAHVHVGAVYLNELKPISGAGATACVQPGVYVAEVTRGLDVDALSSSLQPFPVIGTGTTTRASSGEVWLFGQTYDAEDDATPLVDLAGTVVVGGAERPFRATFTIGKNRVVPPRDPAQPGTNPLCKLRVVAPVPVDLTPRGSGGLLLRIDPRAFFANVDFAAVTPESDGTLTFRDSVDDAASAALFSGVRSTIDTWAFSWLSPEERKP